MHSDPKRELDNLQILKESITTHGHIRTHLAVLFHGDEHLILLPWAHHLDLDHLLREGRDFLGRQVYDFNTAFPTVFTHQESVIKDICHQMRHIAHALDWLHRGVSRHGPHNNRVYFAHMDLKPDNILIDKDTSFGIPSLVGKWVLTDFGLSAFKENDQLHSSDIRSIRDYYERNLSINIPARRPPGTYQPPELEYEEQLPGETRDLVQQGSAGRRGDIWSFGCILAEVVAFSAGQASAVRNFRNSRKGPHKNDYFYENIRTSVLSSGRTQRSYQVRPGIINWLRKLKESYSPLNGAVDCCVETVLDILVPDGLARPKAPKLLAMMEHVEHHMNSDNDSRYLLNCPFQRLHVRRSDETMKLEAFSVPPLAKTTPTTSSLQIAPKIGSHPLTNETDILPTGKISREKATVDHYNPHLARVKQVKLVQAKEEQDEMQQNELKQAQKKKDNIERAKIEENIFHQKLFTTPELRQKSSSEYIYYYYSSSRISTLVNLIMAFIIFVLLVLPVIAMYKLTSIGNRASTLDAIGILVVFTLLFSAAMSVLTKAARHELVAASAAYCSVLVVFISNFGGRDGACHCLVNCK